MTRDDFKRVKRWLYSIRLKELAISNLQAAIRDLDAKLNNPPTHLITSISNYEWGGGGQSETASKEERYAAWMEETKVRRDMLADKLTQYQQEVKFYRDTLQAMQEIEKWGAMGVTIIEKKYYSRVPDRAIYTMFLFCSERAFYYIHQRALQFFYDVLPNIFLKEKCSNGAVKTENLNL